MRRRNTPSPSFDGFLIDLFPEEYIAKTQTDLFGEEMLMEVMDRRSIQEAVVRKALHEESWQQSQSQTSPTMMDKAISYVNRKTGFQPTLNVHMHGGTFVQHQIINHK